MDQLIQLHSFLCYPPLFTQGSTDTITFVSLLLFTSGSTDTITFVSLLPSTHHPRINWYNYIRFSATLYSSPKDQLIQLHSFLCYPPLITRGSTDTITFVSLLPSTHHPRINWYNYIRFSATLHSSPVGQLIQLHSFLCYPPLFTQGSTDTITFVSLLPSTHHPWINWYNYIRFSATLHSSPMDQLIQLHSFLCYPPLFTQGSTDTITFVSLLLFTSGSTDTITFVSLLPSTHHPRINWYNYIRFSATLHSSPKDQLIQLHLFLCYPPLITRGSTDTITFVSLLPSTHHPRINWYNYIRFSATLHSSPKDQLIQLRSFLCYPPLITQGSTDTITFIFLLPSTHHPRINWYNNIRFSATLHSSPKDQLIQLHSFLCYPPLITQGSTDTITFVSLLPSTHHSRINWYNYIRFSATLYSSPKDQLIQLHSFLCYPPLITRGSTDTITFVSLLPSTHHPRINWYNYIHFSATLHSSPKDQLIQLHSFLCYPPLITQGSTDTITFISLLPSTHHPRINWYNYIRFSATLHSSPKDQLIQLHSFLCYPPLITQGSTDTITFVSLLPSTHHSRINWYNYIRFSPTLYSSPNDQLIQLHSFLCYPPLITQGSTDTITFVSLLPSTHHPRINWYNYIHFSATLHSSPKDQLIQLHSFLCYPPLITQGSTDTITFVSLLPSTRHPRINWYNYIHFSATLHSSPVDQLIQLHSFLCYPPLITQGSTDTITFVSLLPSTLHPWINWYNYIRFSATLHSSPKDQLIQLHSFLCYPPLITQGSTDTITFVSLLPSTLHPWINWYNYIRFSATLHSSPKDQLIQLHSFLCYSSPVDQLIQLHSFLCYPPLITQGSTDTITFVSLLPSTHHPWINWYNYIRFSATLHSSPVDQLIQLHSFLCYPPLFTQGSTDTITFVSLLPSTHHPWINWYNYIRFSATLHSSPKDQLIQLHSFLCYPPLITRGSTDTITFVSLLPSTLHPWINWYNYIRFSATLHSSPKDQLIQLHSFLCYSSPVDQLIQLHSFLCYPPLITQGSTDTITFVSLLPSTHHPRINWYNYICFSATLHSSPADQLIQLHSFLCYPPLITQGLTDTITFVSLLPSTLHPRINWYNYVRFSATLHSSPKDQLIQLHSFFCYPLLITQGSTDTITFVSLLPSTHHPRINWYNYIHFSATLHSSPKDQLIQLHSFLCYPPLITQGSTDTITFISLLPSTHHPRIN